MFFEFILEGFYKLIILAIVYSDFLGHKGSETCWIEWRIFFSIGANNDSASEHHPELVSANEELAKDKNNYLSQISSHAVHKVWTKVNSLRALPVLHCVVWSFPGQY